MPELDSRICDYASAIVRDADLLLADADNLNDEQKRQAETIKKYAAQFQSLYTTALPYFNELNDEGRMIAHDLRRPLQNVEGYCGILLTIDNQNLSDSQTQLLHQIEAAHDFIRNAFTTWINSDQDTDYQSI